MNLLECHSIVTNRPHSVCSRTIDFRPGLLVAFVFAFVAVLFYFFFLLGRSRPPKLVSVSACAGPPSRSQPKCELWRSNSCATNISGLERLCNSGTSGFSRHITYHYSSHAVSTTSHWLLQVCEEGIPFTCAGGWVILQTESQTVWSPPSLVSDLSSLELDRDARSRAHGAICSLSRRGVQRWLQRKFGWHEQTSVNRVERYVLRRVIRVWNLRDGAESLVSSRRMSSSPSQARPPTTTSWGCMLHTFSAFVAFYSTFTFVWAERQMVSETRDLKSRSAAFVGTCTTSEFRPRTWKDDQARAITSQRYLASRLKGYVWSEVFHKFVFPNFFIKVTIQDEIL